MCLVCFRRVVLASVLVLLHTLGPGLASLTICIAYGGTDERLVFFLLCFLLKFFFFRCWESLTAMMAGTLWTHSLALNVVYGGARLIASGIVAVFTSPLSLGGNH